MTDRIRVVSFNSAKGDGAYRRRLAGMAAALSALDPDIVLLQEALLSADGRFDTARELGNALGVEYTSFAVREKPRRVEGETVLSWSSPAVLTRWPLLATRPLPLPWHTADGERVALGALIDSPAGRLRVVNAHLTHLPAEGLRQQQLDVIRRSPWLAEPAALRLLGGDLNASPGSRELAALFDSATDWRAVDAIAAGGAAGGTLVDLATGKRRPTRVDHLILLRMADDPPVAVLDSQIVLGEGPDGQPLSDHLGVLADLRVATKSEAGALV